MDNGPARGHPSDAPTHQEASGFFSPSTAIQAPAISVVIPCYNQARFLGDAILSLEAQTVSDWECVIVDDGSTDNTAAVAASFAASDGRIKIVRQSNRGLSGARNAGIALSRGRYLQLLDCDDLLVSTKFERQLGLLSAIPELALSYTDYRYCPANDVTATSTRDDFAPPEFVTGKPLWDMATRWETELSIPAHCFIFDARFFTEHHIRFDESLPNHEDWDCWLQVLALDPKVLYVPEKLAIYRLHDRSMTRDIASMRKGFDAALEKQLAAFADDPLMRDRLSRKRAQMRLVYRNAQISLPRRLVRFVTRAISAGLRAFLGTAT